MRPSPLASQTSVRATQRASAAKPTLAANQSRWADSASPAAMAAGPCLGSSGGADIGLLGRILNSVEQPDEGANLGGGDEGQGEQDVPLAAVYPQRVLSGVAG